MSDSQYQITDFDLSMPIDLIKSEVLNQIFCRSPIYSIRKNLLSVFCKKMDLQKEQYATDDSDVEPDIEEVITDQYDDFFKLIVNQFRDVCGINIDTNSGEFNAENVKYIYDMFIVRLNENIIEYLAQYINANKNTYAAQFQDDETANMTVRMARKTYKNKQDATIAIHMREIVDMIIQDENTLNPETIVNILYRYNPEDYEYLLVYNLFQVLYISFDITKFIGYIRTIYSDPVTTANLHVSILERLLPTFKLKDAGDSE